MSVQKEEESTENGSEMEEQHSPGGEQHTDDESLPLDQVFEILKNRRRREVLKYLNGREGSVTLSDLAEHVAAIENNTTVQALSSSQRKRVYVGLYQCHLPKMDDMDIVDFDQDRGRIELGENADRLEQYLDDGSSDTYWYYYYASTTLLGVGLYALSQAGAATVGLTPTVALGALVVAVLVVAVLHYASVHGHLGSLRSKLPDVPGLPFGQRS